MKFSCPIFCLSIALTIKGKHSGRCAVSQATVKPFVRRDQRRCGVRAVRPNVLQVDLSEQAAKRLARSQSFLLF